jgi:hypothetical protein
MATEVLRQQLGASAREALCGGELERAEHLCSSLLRLERQEIAEQLERSQQLINQTSCTIIDDTYESRPYLITAIISTYNAARFLEGRLVNLLEQSIAVQLEILVIDSASPQNEQDIVRTLQQKHHNIRYFRTERRESVYQAWNRGVAAARGTYLTNANCDDRLRPDALELMVTALEQGYDVAYADSLLTWGENETFASYHAYEATRRPSYSRNALLEGCITGSHPMWRAALHNRIGMFDPAYASAGDYDFFARAARQARFIHVPEALGLVWTSPETFSGKGFLPNMEFYAVRERYRYLLEPTGSDHLLTSGQEQILEQALALLAAGADLTALDEKIVASPRLCYEIGLACEQHHDGAAAWRYLQRAYYLAPETSDYRSAMARVLKNSLRGSIMALASENNFLLSSDQLMTAALAAELCGHPSISAWLYTITLELEPDNAACTASLAKLLPESPSGGIP